MSSAAPRRPRGLYVDFGLSQADAAPLGPRLLQGLLLAGLMGTLLVMGGLMLCSTGIGAILGIPMIILAVPAFLGLWVLGTWILNHPAGGRCPACGVEIHYYTRFTLCGRAKCPACGRSILRRPFRPLRTE